MFKIAKKEQNVIYIQNHGTPLHLVACDEDQTISSDQDIYSKGIVDECNQFEAALESAFEFYIDSISAKSNENEVVSDSDIEFLQYIMKSQIINNKINELIDLNDEGIVSNSFIDRYVDIFTNSSLFVNLGYTPSPVSTCQISMACTVKDENGNLINYHPVECTEIFRTKLHCEYQTD